MIETVIRKLFFSDEEKRIQENSDRVKASIMELTEKLQQKERELHDQNARLNSILESQHDCIARADIETGEILFCNAAYRSMFNHPDPCKDKLIFKHIDPSYAADFEDDCKALINYPYRIDTELPMVTKDGEVRWFHVEVSGISDYDGDITEVQYVIRDIHHQKILAEELKKRCEDQALLLDSLESLLWYVTDPYTFGTVNQAFADFFGVEKDSVEGRPIRDIFPEDQAEHCIALNKKVHAQGERVAQYEWLSGCYGKPHLFSVTRAPMKNGSIKYIVNSAIEAPLGNNKKQESYV